MGEILHGRTVLLFFCYIQFFTYFDRGVMSGLLTYAEDKWELNGVQSGSLGSSYFISVMVVAPLVAGALTGATGKFQIYGIVFGSLLWAGAAACCGLAPSYAMLLTGRILTGLGEAFYCVLASPIIDDRAPPGNQSFYLGAFYSLVYVATGVGFVAPSWSEDWDSGSILFFIEAALMVPLIIYGFIYADRFHGRSIASSANTQTVAIEDGSQVNTNVILMTWRVLSAYRYFLFFMGYGALVFSLNGWNFWGPAYMEEVLHLKKATGSIELGAVVVVAGLAGSALGGWALDRSSEGRTRIERSIAAARICVLSASLALPFGIVATMMRNQWGFVCFAALYMFFLTLSTAPCIVGMMEVVPSDCRGIAMGLSSFGSHIFGDVLSPLLVGFLKDKFDSLVPGMWVLALWGVVTIFCWGLASLPPKDIIASSDSMREVMAVQ